jgi:hypothetical protein
LDESDEPPKIKTHTLDRINTEQVPGRTRKLSMERHSTEEPKKPNVSPPVNDQFLFPDRALPEMVHDKKFDIETEVIEPYESSRKVST